MDLLESGQHVGPHTYEVGIRARPEDLLDWDKPLTKQSASCAVTIDGCVAGASRVPHAKPDRRTDLSSGKATRRELLRL